MNYVLFTNDTTEIVWDDYRAIRRGDKLKRGHAGGDGESELFECSILYLFKFDDWIMTVVKFCNGRKIVEERGRRYVWIHSKRFFLFSRRRFLSSCTNSSINGC